MRARREPLDDTDVEVSSPRCPDGRRYGYSSAADARNHADEWVAFGIAVTTNGTRQRASDASKNAHIQQLPGANRELRAENQQRRDKNAALLGRLREHAATCPPAAETARSEPER